MTPTTATYPTTLRVHYIDAMRGFLMLLVVYHHVLLHLFGVVTPTAAKCATFRMPMFFFISGFVAYTANLDAQKIKQKINRRITKQLIPTIILMLLCILTLMPNFSSLIYSEFKGGYWFTISLVETFLFYCSLEWVFLKCNATSRVKDAAYIVIALTFMIITNKYSAWMFDNKYLGVFSLAHTISLTGYFFLGILARKYSKWFLKATSFWPIIPIAAVCIVEAPRIMDRLPVTIELFAILGILAVFTLFYLLRDYFSKDNTFNRSLIYIGQHTLEIYLLHYFILYGARSLFTEQLDSLSIILSRIYTEIPFIALIAILVTFTSLLIDRLLLTRPTLHRLLFAN